MRYLNSCIGYKAVKQKAELSRLNRRGWGVELCAVSELSLMNRVLLGILAGFVYLFIYFHRLKLLKLYKVTLLNLKVYPVGNRLNGASTAGPPQSFLIQDNQRIEN